MTVSINLSNRVKTELYIGFYPQYNCDFIDREPCKAAPSSADIRGFLTTVPNMGSVFYLAFVGEAVDARWFGSKVQVDNWGDSGTYAASWTHTYTTPGVYWARVGTSGGAKATRPVRVIYRTPPGGTFTPYDINYPIQIGENSEGSVDTNFSCQFTIFTDGRVQASTIVSLKDRMGIGIFAQEYRDYAPYGNLRCISAGLLTDPETTMTNIGNAFTFVTQSFSYYVNMAYMREQDYTSPEFQSMIIAADAHASGTLTTDYLGLGYIPNHWLQADAVTVANHVLQHLRVQVFDVPGNPNMQYPQETQPYGMLSQFVGFTTDADYNEANGLPGNKLQGFTVPEGNVLSNIRSNLLDKEGWRMYDRCDGTMVIERKPGFRTTFGSPILALTDLSKLGNNLRIQGGDKLEVRQVIVERPPDSSMMPAIDNSPSGGYSPTNPYDSMATSDTYNPADCASGGSSGSPSGGASGPANGWYSNNSGMQSAAADYAGGTLNPDTTGNPYDTIDLAKYQYKWPDPERTVGHTVTVSGIYSVDLETWAKGYDKLVRSRYQIPIPLLNCLDGDVGQLITITLTLGNPWNIAWVNKKFDIIAVQIYFDLRSKTTKRMITVKEIDPDE